MRASPFYRRRAQRDVARGTQQDGDGRKAKEKVDGGSPSQAGRGKYLRGPCPSIHDTQAPLCCSVPAPNYHDARDETRHTEEPVFGATPRLRKVFQRTAKVCEGGELRPRKMLQNPLAADRIYPEPRVLFESLPVLPPADASVPIFQ